MDYLTQHRKIGHSKPNDKKHRPKLCGNFICGGEVFRPWGPSSLLDNGYRVSFPEVKRPGRSLNHRPPSSTGVKERLELYLYSPSGSSWPVLGRKLPLLEQKQQSRPNSSCFTDYCLTAEIGATEIYCGCLRSNL
jgi:hypothetical protein